MMDYYTVNNNNRRDIYYQDENQYYQCDATSPTSSVPNNYRLYSDERFENIGNKTATRRGRRNSYTPNNMIDQQYERPGNNNFRYYYNHGPQPQQQQQNYYMYQLESQPNHRQYNHNNNRSRRSSKAQYNEDEREYQQQEVNHNQFQLSPEQNYQEVIYSPQKKSSPKKKHVRHKQYNDFPITPDDDERRSFVYSDEAGENGVDNTETEDIGMYYTGGEQTQQQNTTSEEFVEDIEDDEETQFNTRINSEFKNNNAVTDHYGNVSPISTLDINFQQSQQQEQQPQQELKKKWDFKKIVSTAFNKMKTLNNNSKRRDSAAAAAAAVAPTSYFPSGIQVITATDNELLGDVLDARQQRNIITQLQSPLPATSVQMSPEKTKITSLDRIWVFRLFDEDQQQKNQNHPIAWTGFDYENQEKIEKHIKELENGKPEEGRLAIYDSHVRHKSMPVIVTPQHEKGYYFADVNQMQLITLEVTFIENHHQKVTFVYRV